MGKVSAVIAGVIMFAAVDAAAVDWSTVKGKDIVLLYPATMSWEMLLSPKEHSGAEKFREGRTCRQCHDGEESNSGTLLVGDRKSEPHAIANKPGHILANVKTAIEADNLLIHLEVDTSGQPDAGQEKDFDTKIAVMFDDGKVNEVANAGCWAACHDNLAKMPSGGDGEVTKYLTRSRVKMARSGGAEIKPEAELQKLRDGGQYLEYWQARLKQGAAPVAVDGTVLEKRQENATPITTAESSFANGKWTVTFSRKLNAPAPYKLLAPGQTYTIGFSVHAGHTAQRFHYVSLEKTLVLEKGTADFVAERK